MVKHIVLFKLKDEVPEAEKLVVMNKFKEAIEAFNRLEARYNPIVLEGAGSISAKSFGKFYRFVDSYSCRYVCIIFHLIY